MPNLFDFATSELSQDAFLCWLISWADEEAREQNEELSNCARNLLDAIYRKAGFDGPGDYDGVVVQRQTERIDVLVIINNEYYIIIEDKVHSPIHGNQLPQAIERIQNRGVPGDRILPIFFKTGDQSCYDEVIVQGFHPFLRTDLLNVLSPHRENIDSDIFRDYLDYLEGYEDRFQSFRRRILEEWTWESWLGFFSCLQEYFPDGRWDYIPNHQGGFWGFWWPSLAIEGGKIYFQIEENKLCVKILVESGNNRTEMRNAWYEQIQETADDLEVDLTRPNSFGYGSTMTVAVSEMDFRQTNEGILDLDGTLATLLNVMVVLDRAVI